MPDPVSEYAEYVVIARRGIAKLYLCQRGQWQDPGAVAVTCARPLGAKQAVTRWLGRIRRVVMDRLPRMGDEAEVSSRYAVAPARQVPGPTPVSPSNPRGHRDETLRPCGRAGAAATGRHSPSAEEPDYARVRD
jgi:hypothetical protein